MLGQPFLRRFCVEVSFDDLYFFCEPLSASVSFVFPRSSTCIKMSVHAKKGVPMSIESAAPEKNNIFSPRWALSSRSTSLSKTVFPGKSQKKKSSEIKPIPASPFITMTVVFFSPSFSASLFFVPSFWPSYFFPISSMIACNFWQSDSLPTNCNFSACTLALKKTVNLWEAKNWVVFFVKLTFWIRSRCRSK